MSSTPTSQKSRLVKIGLAVLAAIAGVGAGDAAGYAFDIDALKDLTDVRTIALIAYLELRIVPIGLRIAARDKREAEEEAKATAAHAAAPIASPTVATGRVPRIAVVRPGSATDEP